MLMPRIPYHLTNGYNPGVNIALNMQHQQQHINQLLNTAATGTGIVGDVDALLTPIQNNNPTIGRMESAGRERNLWRTNEIMEVLKIMQEINAVDMLNDKTVKSEVIFRKVERLMYSRGYRKKTNVQIWTKWKFLKSTYRTSRRNGVIPKMIPQIIYDELHKMLINSNNNYSGRSTSDCGNSATSLDGDNSNSGIANTSGSSLNDSHQLIISGVEGGYDGSKSSPDGAAGGANSDEENGLAHPIFGFRLGLVKQEPPDTDYEAPKVKEKETTANIEFQTEIKQELNDEPNYTGVPSTSTKPSQPQVDNSTQNKLQSSPEIMILSRRVAVPSNTFSKTPTGEVATTTISTITPNAAIASQTRISSASTSNPSPLPPLRIAPFAKVSSNDNQTPKTTTSLPPPPPLAMNPTTSRALRLNSAYSSTAYAAAMAVKNNAMNKTNSTSPGIIAYQRKLMPNHMQSTPPTQPTGLSSRPPVLEPFMRRQEVVVPDLDVKAAASEYRSSQPFYGFPDGPSTSQQAQQQQQQQQQMQIDARKRRLRQALMMSTIPPPKRMTRQADQIIDTSTARRAAFKFGSEQIVDDDGQNPYSSGEEIRMPTYRGIPTAQRQVPSPTTTETTTNTTNNNIEREREQQHARILQDVSLTLRQMQREVINEFFKRQMKLVREEHEFQMKQDEMLMEAFNEQAIQFQEMRKELLGSALKIEKRKKKLEKQTRKQMMNKKKTMTERQAQARKEENKNYKNKNQLLNGIKGKQSNMLKQQNEETDEAENGVELIMRSVQAQLDLSDEDGNDDASNEQNQYEYNSYNHDNSEGEMEQESLDTKVQEQNEAIAEESDEGTEYTHSSEPMQIIGH